MPNFLLEMEYTLETAVIALVIGFILGSFLIWLIKSLSIQARLSKVRQELQQEITASEQQRMQLATELNNLQQKIQQTDVKISEQSESIAQLEQEKHAIQSELTRIVTLEAEIKQKSQTITELSEKLQQTESLQQQLQQAQQDQQALQNAQAEKEAAIAVLTQIGNERQAALQTQTELTEQQAAVAKEQTAIANELSEQVKFLEQDLQIQQAEKAGLVLEKSQLQQQLEQTASKMQDLEQQLNLQAERYGKLIHQPAQNSELEEQLRSLQRELAMREEAVATLENELSQVKAKLQAQPQPEAVNVSPAKADEGLTKKLAEQDATIAGLNNALAEQANLIFRLEYDLETKKALLADQKRPLQAIPAAIVAKQEQADAKIAELEFRLNPKKAKQAEKTSSSAEKPAVKLAEFMPKLPEFKSLPDFKSKLAELTPKFPKVSSAKQEEVAEIADKVEQIPERVKGFFSKFLSKK
jgi:chromosome segregation ATPase